MCKRTQLLELSLCAVPYAIEVVEQALKTLRASREGEARSVINETLLAQPGLLDTPIEVIEEGLEALDRMAGQVRRSDHPSAKDGKNQSKSQKKREAAERKAKRDANSEYIAALRGARILCCPRV